MFDRWTKPAGVNPILGPNADATFVCPLAGPVAWRAKDVFNPAAIVHQGKVHLLLRAEDEVGPFAGTSRIGLATSTDGLHFTVEPEPVLFPADDEQRDVEWPGGCEDPHIVAHPDGGFVMTYTAYDGKRARLMVATSPDLRAWTKHGRALAEPFADLWAKAGSIVSASGVAKNVDGRFWMYFGESDIFAATSTDLVRWDVVTTRHLADRTFTPGVGREVVEGPTVPWPIVGPRPGRFDELLVEPGPPAVWTPEGIHLIYNGSAPSGGRAQPGTPAGGVRYCPGLLSFDPVSPTQVISRCTEPLLVPDQPFELDGQVDAVCFAEGLVHFGGRWLLYYGTADSQIAVAECVD
ncbi:MAG: glycoside hydrolase family 130 protein [Planctomycetota bacterium]